MKHTFYICYCAVQDARFFNRKGLPWTYLVYIKANGKNEKMSDGKMASGKMGQANMASGKS